MWAGAAAMLVATTSAGVPGDARLDAARRAIDAGRYAEAESALVREVREGEGDAEALFLLAGLVTDGREAQRLYGAATNADPGGTWGLRARVESAKIDYALGRYARAWTHLDEADACDESPEACLFQGLSALMLERYEDARRVLRRVRRGKLRTWAWLAMAESDARRGRLEEACERYEALADAMVSPTALYRYGECLENQGDRSAAVDVFDRLAGAFGQTPEGVLAAEKVHRIEEHATTAGRRSAPVNAKPVERLERGYTIQFGSFRDRGNAIKLASRIRRVYPGVRIDTELVRYREYHRVRYGYFRSREDAERMAQTMSDELNEAFSIMTLP